MLDALEEGNFDQDKEEYEDYHQTEIDVNCRSIQILEDEDNVGYPTLQIYEGTGVGESLIQFYQRDPDLLDANNIHA